jgi:hypothetical protein
MPLSKRRREIFLLDIPSEIRRNPFAVAVTTEKNATPEIYELPRSGVA